VTGKSGRNGGESTSGNGGASHDALGDTHLGRSLKELIKEIGKEKDAAQQGLAPGATAAAEGQDAESFDLTASRFDQDLAEAVSAERGAATGRPAAPPEEATAAEDGAAPAELDAAQVLAGMETLIKRFAEAERRRCEQELAEWKDQLKKATMIVIKKQVDTARARWMQSQGVNQAKLAEQYQRLKALADKVARQKTQIQKAKLELEQKLEVADKLHSEFDEIRNVLGGQIGAIDALDKSDEPGDA
jgi:hypothetical protein